MSLKDLVCGLALLAHGSIDEKAKCNYRPINSIILSLVTVPPIVVLSLMMSSDGVYVTRDAVDEMVAACDAGAPVQVNVETLFMREPSCSISRFEKWVKSNPNLSSFTR